MLENGDVNIELTAAAGTDGEEITARLFSDGGYRVVNVARNRGFQGRGIDLLCYKEDGGAETETKVEVKTDGRMWRTGNLFCETKIERPDARIQPGWLLTSQMQVLVYNDARNGIGYFFDFQLLKDYALQNERMFRDVTAPDPYDPGSRCCGILLPLFRVIRDIPQCLIEYHVIPELEEIRFPDRFFWNNGV